MKKSPLFGFITSIFVFSANSTIWIGGVFPNITHFSCEIVLEEALYVKNIEFIEKLKSYGFHPLKNPEDAIGHYLYLNKLENEIIIYDHVQDNDFKLWHSSGDIPFCEKSEI